MDRQFTARIVRGASMTISGLPAGAQIVGIVTLFAAFLWAISVASVLVCLVLTIVVAAAWCFWLEEHSDILDTNLARQARDLDNNGADNADVCDGHSRIGDVCHDGGIRRSM